ncbi:MAG: ATP-binding cassette domain-containing protein [Syntrophomonadaceae bacterium]|nr:ATP-binding cassette domain-containing protein [Syntrophomonadaceae bacterium]
MQNDSEYLVEVKNIWKTFGNSKKIIPRKLIRTNINARDRKIVAVNDVSFQVKRGEVYVIMGLSGSGKSTLIRCLLRLIEPDSGTALIEGKDVTAMDKRQLTEFRRTRVAMVFQHYGLLPHRSVLENVAFGLKLRGVERKEREQKAAEVIEKVGLKQWEKHYPSELSGGMQQRVGIARALVQDADLLLLDEPFSGLDPLIRREMQDELLRLQHEFQKTMIFVTHDLNEALRLGSHMAVMKNGAFIQEGRPHDIVMNPVDDYVKQFVQIARGVVKDSPDKKGKIRSLPRRASGQDEPIIVGFGR